MQHFQKYMILQKRDEPEINRILLGRIKEWGRGGRLMLARQSTAFASFESKLIQHKKKVI